MSNDRIPVTTLEELDSFDEAEVVQGYVQGRAGKPEPDETQSKAIWHGWRNGMIDSGRMISDTAYYSLARLVVDRNKQ